MKYHVRTFVMLLFGLFLFCLGVAAVRLSEALDGKTPLITQVNELPAEQFRVYSTGSEVQPNFGEVGGNRITVNSINSYNINIQGIVPFTISLRDGRWIVPGVGFLDMNTCIQYLLSDVIICVDESNTPFLAPLPPY